MAWIPLSHHFLKTNNDENGLMFITETEVYDLVAFSYTVIEKMAYFFMLKTKKQPSLLVTNLWSKMNKIVSLYKLFYVTIEL